MLRYALRKLTALLMEEERERERLMAMQDLTPVANVLTQAAAALGGVTTVDPAQYSNLLAQAQALLAAIQTLAPQPAQTQTQGATQGLSPAGG
jgi:hypothetical protein